MRSKVNLIDELIKEFEAENPGIKVVHQNFPYDNYEQKLAAAIATGKGPNIINIFYGWVPKYVKSGVLQELPTDVFDPAEMDKEFSPMIQTNKIEGKYYTIPTAVRTSALSGCAAGSWGGRLGEAAPHRAGLFCGLCQWSGWKIC